MKIKEILKLLGLFLLGGIIGGVIGLSGLSPIVNVLTGIWEYLRYGFTGLFYISPIFALFMIYKYFEAKKMVKMVNDDDDSFIEADKKLETLMSYTNVFILCNFVLMGLVFEYSSVWWFLLIFMFNLFTAIFIQILTIKGAKKLYPEKQGDPTSFNFNKVWYDSCDEAEKLLIGESAYKSYVATAKVSFILLIITILLRFADLVDEYSVLVVGIIMITLNVIYVLNARKGSTY